MTNRLISSFSDLRARPGGRKGLIPFICGGHPSLATMGDILRALEASGATAVEIGIPFSDPIADGPVIAAAMHDALKAGVTPDAIFREVRRARDAGLRVPLVAMVSVSIAHRTGAERFISAAASAGFDGLIVPDVPVEEAESLAPIAAANGLTLTLLVAPTTSPERAARIARACSGFIYLLARVGITGQAGGTVGGAVASDALAQRVRALRAQSQLPIACGFGISSANDVRAVVCDGGADAAIVGSALVKRLSTAAQTQSDPGEAASQLMRELGAGVA